MSISHVRERARGSMKMLLILRITVGRAWNVAAGNEKKIYKQATPSQINMPIGVWCALNFTEESLKIKDMRSMNATCTIST